MMVYMLATNEPMSTRFDTLDQYGNPLPDLLLLYLRRDDAEEAVIEYNKEFGGEASWIVEVEVKESQPHCPSHGYPKWTN